MSRHYSEPARESETHSLPDVEVFYKPCGCMLEHGDFDSECEALMHEPGWYWWVCFPGCLPEGEPTGPFKSEQEAIDDMRRTCDE